MMRLPLIGFVLFILYSTACVHNQHSLATDVEEVNSLFREKRYAACVPLYQHLAAKTYQKGFYYYMTARCYSALNDYGNCAKYLRKSIGYSPYYFEKFEDEKNHFESFCSSAQTLEINQYGQRQISRHHWQIDSILLKNLLALSGQDQLYRKRIIAAAKANDQILYDSLARLQRAIDTTVSAKFLTLLEKEFPNNANAGAQGAGLAMTLIQHVPHAAKVKLLPVVKKQVKQHYLSYGSYANLYDRIRMEAGQCQKYGTQQQIIDGKPCLYCVENPAGLTERRAKIGFPPVDTSLSPCIKKP